MALRAWADRFEPLRPAVAIGQAARTAAVATVDAVEAAVDALAASNDERGVRCRADP
jgi:hypothetical protein